MARPSRLSLPGVVHYVVQRGHNGAPIAHDVTDAEELLRIVRDSATSLQVRLHAYALEPSALRLLATPQASDGISRLMQAIGRRYAATFNRRHGRSGTLWDGRFRSVLVEDGEHTLLLLRLIDAHATASTGSHRLPDGADPACSSRAHRTGGRRDPSLVDPEAYWQLGNTPFEREARYRSLLEEPPGAAETAALQAALQAGWGFGSVAFLSRLAAATGRPLRPRPRGRPALTRSAQAYTDPDPIKD
jgi:putative transposase